jgi:hypothetical protein
MKLGTLELRIDQLVTTLRSFNGHRGVWLAADGEIWHAEPEDDLQDSGCIYLATLMQPSREELVAVLLPLVQLDQEARLRVGRWSSNDAVGAGLIAPA